MTDTKGHLHSPLSIQTIIRMSYGQCKLSAASAIIDAIRFLISNKYFFFASDSPMQIVNIGINKANA
jgi:hypothetical protein